MRFKVFLTSVFTILFAVTCSSLCAQQGMLQVAKNYFRSNPFDREFSQFLQHLLNDPTLTNKVIRKKTDSTLFFLDASYSTHSPFTFKPIRTRIILAEREDVLVRDSISELKTVYQYQLVGYAPPGEDGLQDVRSEYEKFIKKIRRSFSTYQKSTTGTAENPTGEITDFSFPTLHFMAVTIAWINSKEQENLFAVTVRFQVADNYAYLPLLRD